MRGLGTIINAAAIIVGSLAGMLFKSKISSRFQDSIMKTLGLSVIFIGVSGGLTGLLKINENGGLATSSTMLMIASLTIGVIIGEAINIEDKLERLGEWLKKKAGSSDSRFVEGFVTASLTVCVGAMAIVGAIEDGLTGNFSTLLAKSILDAVITMIFAAAYGKGVAFSAIPVAVLQGAVTLCAGLISPIFSESVIANISYIGSILIFCVGVNLSFGKKFKVANMLPAVIVPIIYGIFAA